MTAGLAGAADKQPDPLVPLPAPLELKSPDGKIALHFNLSDIGKEKGCPVYNVTYEGRPVLADSRLGLHLRDLAYTHNFNLLAQNTRSSDTTWKPVLGERESVRDNYNELTVELRMARNEPFARKMNLTFRAYNEGVAFAYTVPEDEVTSYYVDIIREITQFAFTADHTTWPVYGAQADYTKSETTLSKIQPGAECALTVRVEDHLYASIAYARAADYARMKLRRSTDGNTTLEAMLDGWGSRDGDMAVGEVVGKAPLTTPWRVVMLAESPGKLLEQNYLILNLNDPCALADTSWIKPGKVIREAAFTTESGKAAVDFAVKHKMQYIEYDAGWYGTEWKTTSDARAVDPKLQQRLNLQEVIDYGASKGIGVILYINQHAMEYQLDEFLPIYEKWGVKGVKYGFVNVGSQLWTARTHEAIRKAAEHHLMVDIHDEYRSMGYERTYPNLIQVEGIGGDETNPTAEHNAALPFTRYLTGPADHTYCWNSKTFKNNKAHQLAITTIFYSPWAFLYWYDGPKNIPDEPGLEFWDSMPTTWDETRVLQGDIGRRAVVARRKGSEWYLGAIAPVDGKFSIAFNFLTPGKKYVAKIFTDAPASSVAPEPPVVGNAPGAPVIRNKPGVQVEEKVVDSQTQLNVDIPQRGGVAVRLVPQ